MRRNDKYEEYEFAHLPSFKEQVKGLLRKDLMTFEIMGDGFSGSPRRDNKVGKDKHFPILLIIKQNPNITAKQLSTISKRNLTSIQHSIKYLMDKGLIKREMRTKINTDGRWGFLYKITDRSQTSLRRWKR